MDDEYEISHTLAAYSQRCDDGAFERWADLFTEDAQLSFPGHVAEGRDAIRTLMEKVQADGSRGKHVTSNSMIEVDGDRATAVTDYLFVRGGPEGFSIVSAGRYRDTAGAQRWALALSRAAHHVPRRTRKLR